MNERLFILKKERKTNEVKRSVIKKFCVLVLFFAVGTLAFLTVPLASFSKLSYDEICAQAAGFYGITESEYNVAFTSQITSDAGRDLTGLYKGYNIQSGIKVHNIEIKKSWLRSTVIATIFHEFAHAAQVKYDLDLTDHTREQHAEILSFSIMWENGYRWEALHLLPCHTLRAKPAEYNVSRELWDIALTNRDNTNVAMSFQNTLAAFSK